jgi:hypothetical protein
MKYNSVVTGFDDNQLVIQVVPMFNPGHYQKLQSFVAVPSITPLHTQRQENVHVLYDGI